MKRCVRDGIAMVCAQVVAVACVVGALVFVGGLGVWAQSPPPSPPPPDLARQLSDRYKELTQASPEQPPVIIGSAEVLDPATQLATIVSQLRILKTQLGRKTAAAQQDEQNVAVLLEQNRALGQILQEQRLQIAGLQDQLKAGQPKADAKAGEPEPPKP